MRPIFFFIAFSLVSLLSFGQIIVGTTDINRADSIQVVEVFIDRGTFGKSIRAYVDFGQRDNYQAQNTLSRNDNMMITDPATREKKIFKSTAAILNFFESNNWEQYNSLIETVRGTSNFYYYFRKRTIRQE
jgi:hypothetical protein